MTHTKEIKVVRDLTGGFASGGSREAAPGGVCPKGLTRESSLNFPDFTCLPRTNAPPTSTPGLLNSPSFASAFFLWALGLRGLQLVDLAGSPH